MKKVMILLTTLVLAACQSTIVPKEPTIQLSDDLKKLVAPYQIGEPKYRVNRIVLVNEKVANHKIERNIQATDTPNVFIETEKSDNLGSQYIGFLGSWLPLSQNMNFSLTLDEMKNIENYDHQVLVRSYQENISLPHAPVGMKLFRKIDNLQYTCEIIKIIPAHSLHPNIKGNAKEVKCEFQINSSRPKYITTSYYLEDYHYNIGLSISSPHVDYYLKIQSFQ